jgi:hypothetical protein
VKFVTDFELRPPLPDVRTPPPLDVILATMHELIRAGNKHPVSLGPPDEKCQDRLKRIISHQHGRKDFLAAGYEFLRQGQWFDEDERGYRRRVPGWDRPWEKFVYGFDIYLEDAKQREASRVKDEAKQREAEARYLAAVADREAKERWARYLNARDLNWPEMTDADREFIAAVQGTLENVQPVNKEDYQRAEGISNRFWAYKKSTKKYSLLQMFSLMAQRRLKGELKVYPQAYWDEVSRLKKLVDDSVDDNDELLSSYVEEQLRTTSKLSQWLQNEEQERSEQE